MAVVPCTDCKGFVDDSRWEPMRLVKRDEDGFPMLNSSGELTYVYLQLPYHVLPPSKFRTDGLCRAACDHGLAAHPDPTVEEQEAIKRLGRSWVRGKYLDQNGRCPVCRHEEPPEDWLTPRVAA